MTEIGKKIRLERIMNRETGRTVIVPMDHGVTAGPIEGIKKMREAIGQVADGGADATVIHKGLVSKGHRGGGRDIGLILHLSGSTSLATEPNAKTLICSVEEALKLGADAVSVQVNLGNGHESQMLSDLGKIAYDARSWGIPLLAMVYPRGDKIKNAYDKKTIAHCARVADELGADIVKVSYTGSPESFREVTESCTIPVVIAGGEKMETDRQVLEMVKNSIEAGGAGVSMGRNIFQHRNPTVITQAIAAIVHNNSSVEDALSLLKHLKEVKAA